MAAVRSFDRLLSVVCVSLAFLTWLRIRVMHFGMHCRTELARPSDRVIVAIITIVLIIPCRARACFCMDWTCLVTCRFVTVKFSSGRVILTVKSVAKMTRLVLKLLAVDSMATVVRIGLV